MTECPSSATRQSIKRSAEQEEKPPRCAPRTGWAGRSWAHSCCRLTWLRELPGPESAKRGETEPPTTPGGTGLPQRTWQVVAPDQCCFSPTHHLRYFPCSSAAGDRISNFPWGKTCRHFNRLIFLILPYEGKSQSCWAGPLPSFAVRGFHGKS